MKPERDLVERDARVTWHPYTQHATEAEPLAVARAEAATLTLADGRKLIDAISSWWTCLHGHGHPRLVEAMQRQVRELDHVLFAGCTHEPAVALAEELVRVAPAGLTRVFFSDNGSTAVEVALKMAYQRWCHLGEEQRTTFVALEGAYHGDTFGAMSVGDPDPFFSAFAPLLFSAQRVAPDAQALESALESLGERAAGVILEPLVQAAAGMRMHTEEFLRAVRRACDRAGVPLIADEVFTGFGRTGALFACARAGVAPDLLCLAKGLTGGTFPLAVTLTSEAIYEAFLSSDRGRAFFHGHSFTANPIGCAVARASLALCLENEVPARLDAIGARIEAALEPLATNARVACLRRTGGVVALELTPIGGDAGYLASSALGMRARAIELGVLLRPLGNVLYCVPPACTTEREASTIAEAMATLALG
jgi:adenosylmethionine-8-amino-7-oxononanoate aminotransferase